MAEDVEWTIHHNVRQWSVNDLWFCKYSNYTMIWSLLCITDLMPALQTKETAERSPPHAKNDCQWSINDLWLCKYGSYLVIWSLLCITDVLAVCIGKRDRNTVTVPFWEWASKEGQQFVGLWIRQFESDLVAVMHNRSIASCYRQKRQQHGHCRILRMSANRASRICGFVSTVVT